MTRVLITGAAGFVGRYLARDMMAEGFDVVAAVRRPNTPPPGAGVDLRYAGEIDGETDWGAALDGIDVVVHLAARVHVMQDAADDPLAEYRRVNVAGTRRLAEACIKAGVKRLVFLSSVKAAAEAAERPLSESDTPAPQDPYGISKWEGEQALAEAAAGTPLEWVVLRPPLVYGPGVGANFLKLLRLSDSRLPLPLGRVTGNGRSVVYIGNLTSAIITAARHPAAAGNAFFVRDETEPSTAMLVARFRAALGRRHLLAPVPESVMRLGCRALGKKTAADRLFGSLRIDDAKIRKSLGWHPPFSLDQGLAATAAWYRAERARRPAAGAD